ncbi:hypothetical protein Ddye_028321 [Dipteronia dyeriana]|uniref:BHLH domain-containing protein n=1 Tax=Dipteronia dyeriana TaxID=168575 RepID=A0AAD9TQZ4_9ROSI|nr:hypothetical protein Ddye_028321 [Dipteronia dyeriana]
MALEAVVYQQDFLNYNGKELYNLLGGNWGFDYQFGLENVEEEDHHFLENQTDQNGHHHLLQHHNGDSDDHKYRSTGRHHDQLSSSPLPNSMVVLPDAAHFNNYSDLPTTTATATARPKRRRSKSRKNKEEIENQRMTHIAVERNRRKQMNDYLSVLRSLMPESYVQRGDQASIIGGAINFVKELEHRLQLLGAHKEKKEKSENGLESSPPFDEFFTFPQYSTTSSISSSTATTSSSSSSSSSATGCDHNSAAAAMTESAATSSSTATDHHHHNQSLLLQSQSAVADIEVTMVESHANLKIRSKRRSKQLLKLVSELHNLRLTILHLNVTTVDETVLYSLSVKIEEDCNLTSVDDIATAMYQLLVGMHHEFKIYMMMMTTTTT